MTSKWLAHGKMRRHLAALRGQPVAINDSCSNGDIVLDVEETGTVSVIPNSSPFGMALAVYQGHERNGPDRGGRPQRTGCAP